MLNRSDADENKPGQPVPVGTPVLAADGTRIGVVSKQGVQGDLLYVKKGRLFPEEFSVPRSSIVQQNETAILLNLSKDELWLR